MAFTFSIDGRTFNVGVSSLSRKARIPDGKNSGNAKDGTRIRDVKGTFFDYTAVLNTAAGLSQSDYDVLYEILTAPVEFHTVVLPYGQTTMQYQAYIEGVSDIVVADNQDGTTWGNLTVNFYAKSPQRVPEV